MLAWFLASVENYGSSVKDCKSAIKINPAHIKAYIQAVKSLLILSKASEALEMCETGLQVDPENATLTELKQKAFDLKASLEAQIEKRKNEKAEQIGKLTNVFDNLKVSILLPFPDLLKSCRWHGVFFHFCRKGTSLLISSSHLWDCLSMPGCKYHLML